MIWLGCENQRVRRIDGLRRASVRNAKDDRDSLSGGASVGSRHNIKMLAGVLETWNGNEKGISAGLQVESQTTR